MSKSKVFSFGPFNTSLFGVSSLAPSVTLNGWKYDPSAIAGFSPEVLNDSAM